MRRRIRTAMLSGFALAGLVGLGLPALAGASHAPAGTSRVTAIRTATHPGFDRLVFEFSGKLPSHTFVQWAPRITRDGSGATVPAAGNAFLQIGLSGVTGYNTNHAPTFGALRRSTGNQNLNQVVHAGEFEGMVSFGAAMMARTSYKVSNLTKPSRVVIDIRSDYARTRVPVYFTNNATAETRSAWRYVPSGAPANGALHRMFAGPTPAEVATGTGNTLSKATGFTALSISGGIAWVRLVGGCASGGGAFTIANQIDATLSQFPSVQWVKVLSPSGQTGSPSGKTDSIPTCLEP
ncbi:GerMN domain-containing protein [Sporichthya sp.]|uniref:AMIN-like domain-containing (lipo)protein n=1 Tax=Sporichthya sp. TaxID=65475 RepID=UPI00184F20E6|nr:GerMN domain-containing protein [Sporichthya sp.]MBA3744890.1 GerMN domain-containing protein [Sporichthya sp.]